MKIKVKNVEIINFREGPLNKDTGHLCFFETGKDMPFKIKRAFWIFDTTKGARRGNHAHKKSWQIHICFGQSVKILLDDGKNKQEIILDNPRLGLIIGPKVWHSFVLSKGSSLFVLSSNYYSEKDYIRNYGDFMKTIKNKK